MCMMQRIQLIDPKLSQSGTRPVSEASSSHRTAKSPHPSFRGLASVLELCPSWIFKNKSPTKCVQVLVNGPPSLFNLPCPPYPQPDALKAVSCGTVQDKGSTTFSCQGWAVTLADSIHHLVTNVQCPISRNTVCGYNAQEGIPLFTSPLIIASKYPICES